MRNGKVKRARKGVKKEEKCAKRRVRIECKMCERKQGDRR